MPLVNLNPTDLIAFRAETEYSARLALIGHMLDDNITEAVDLEIVRWLLDTLIAERREHRKCRDALRGANIHASAANERCAAAVEAKRNLQQELDQLKEERPTAPVVIHQAKLIGRLANAVTAVSQETAHYAGCNSIDPDFIDLCETISAWREKHKDIIEAAKHDA